MSALHEYGVALNVPLANVPAQTPDEILLIVAIPSEVVPDWLVIVDPASQLRVALMVLVAPEELLRTEPTKTGDGMFVEISVMFQTTAIPFPPADKTPSVDAPSSNWKETVLLDTEEATTLPQMVIGFFVLALTPK